MQTTTYDKEFLDDLATWDDESLRNLVMGLDHQIARLTERRERATLVLSLTQPDK